MKGKQTNHYIDHYKTTLNYKYVKGTYESVLIELIGE